MALYMYIGDDDGDDDDDADDYGDDDVHCTVYFYQFNSVGKLHATAAFVWCAIGWETSDTRTARTHKLIRVWME